MMTKRLFLLFALLLCAGAAHGQTVQCQASNGAWGPCPFVQPVVEAQAVNATTSTAGTSVTHAWGSNTTAANSILCIGMEAAAAVPTFADAQTNTFVVIASSATAPGYSIVEATNIVGGTTDTITMTVTTGGAAFSCHELKGAVTAGQIWDYSAAQQATSATLAFNQQAAVAPNEMIFAMVGMNGGTVNATPSLAGVPTALVTVDQSNTVITAGALDVVYSAHANVSSQPTFTQTVSLSASETYSAVLVSVKPALIPALMTSDPCNILAGSPGNINLTASGQLITGVAGKQTYICSLDLISATAQNIALVEGTGTTCATGIAGMAGGTTAATGWNLAANGGLVKGSGGSWVYKTATTGDNVCLLLSSTGQTSGGYRFVQQ